MNVNFGLFPPLEADPVVDEHGKRLKGADKGRARKQVMARRAIADFEAWLGDAARVAAE